MCGTTQYVILCVWLLSLSITFLRLLYFVACVSASFFFMAKQYSIVWIDLNKTTS